MLLIFNNYYSNKYLTNNQIYYNRTLKYCARELRNNSTKYEKILWNYIKKKTNSKNSILYAKKIKLAIEIYGEYHSTNEMQAKDLNRDQYLNNLGIYILRFSNQEVEFKLLNVISIIKSVVIHRLTYPPSSFEGG